MRIAEIFYSIQGEGSLIGMPSVFVRTSGCNLRCSWCDTKYASWHPEGETQTVDAIVDDVCGYPTEYVVLTGGEPMIHVQIFELATKLKLQGKHITIETAASVPPQGIICDLASLSPKLSNSTPEGEYQLRHEARRRKPDIVREWINKYPFQLKFVVSRAEDIEEIDELLSEVSSRRIYPGNVMLMPEGVTTEAIRGRDETLIELCMERGWRYCNRLHIELFGNTRGT